MNLVFVIVGVKSVESSVQVGKIRGVLMNLVFVGVGVNSAGVFV